MTSGNSGNSGGNPLREANDRVDRTVGGLISRIHVQRGSGRMIVLLIIAVVIFTALKPAVFLNPLNLQNIGLAVPEIGVLALAMTLAMLTGGIDLSVVGIANGAAITISMLYSLLEGSAGKGAAEQSWPLLLVIALAVGLLGGLVNGLLIAFARITPILATLGTMQIFNGIGVVATGGRTLYGFPSSLGAIGQLTVANVPVLFFVFVVVAIVIGVVINKTAIGRRIQFEGANPVASLYSGLNSRRTLMATYLTTGLLAGVAGILIVMRNPTASADYGSSYTLLVIVIAVLGGTNPNGGFSTVLGVVLAAITLQVVSSGFTTLRLTSYEYSIAQGVILIVVMIIDQIDWRRLRRKRAEPPTETVAMAAGR